MGMLWVFPALGYSWLQDAPSLVVPSLDVVSGLVLDSVLPWLGASLGLGLSLAWGCPWVVPLGLTVSLS